uniref:Uncharacterized protein n=1 Tax=Anguilla anguilla TaxID=7936 RepID=A0A0E9TSN1_ANGAN
MVHRFISHITPRAYLSVAAPVQFNVWYDFTKIISSCLPILPRTIL